MTRTTTGTTSNLGGSAPAPSLSAQLAAQDFKALLGREPRADSPERLSDDDLVLAVLLVGQRLQKQLAVNGALLEHAVGELAEIAGELERAREADEEARARR